MDLKLALTLDQQRCLEGESVRFRLALRNTGGEPLEGLPGLEPLTRAVQITARGRGGHKVTGFGLGRTARDGKHQRIHGLSHEPLTLAPDQEVTVEGDLLAWAGALPADEYTLQAVYTLTEASDVAPIVSGTVPLNVLGPHVTAVSVPHLPEMPQPGPLPALWRNGKPGTETVLLQQQSRIMPPNPYRCVRIGNLPADADLRVATAALAQPARGHVVWTSRGDLNLLSVPTDRASQESPTQAATGLTRPSVLAAPRSTTDGRLLTVLADADRARLALVEWTEGQAPSVADWPLEDFGPLGVCNLFWTLDDDALLVWSKAGTGELFAARITPGQPAESFTPRHVSAEVDGLLAIEVLRTGYSDEFFRAGMHLVERRGQPVPIEQPLPESRPAEPPAFTLFVLAFEPRDRQVVLRRVPLSDGAAQVVARWTFAGEKPPKKLECVQSTMTARNEPVFLLRDEQGGCYFVSTEDKRLVPLATRIDRPVPPAAFPCLLAASGQSDAAWVFLRLYDEKHLRFEYEKLEPADRPSPYRLFEIGDPLP